MPTSGLQHISRQLNKRGWLKSAGPAFGNLLADQGQFPGACKKCRQLVWLTPTETENPVSDIEAEALNSSSGAKSLSALL
jgi:hypothetical protein